MHRIYLQAHDDSPPSPRSRLDARLATLMGLGVSAYGAGIAPYEKGERVLRQGPLAFSGARATSLESGSAQDLIVFVTVTSPDAFDRVIADVPGLNLRSRARTIATASVLFSDIPALESHPDVVAIEWSGSMCPVTTAAPDGQARTARRAMGLHAAPVDLDGRGTIVGVIDVEGIDLYHPAFVDSSGRTRVRALWDQRASAPEDESKTEKDRLPGDLPPVEYGMCYDRFTIDDDLSPRQPMPFDVVPHRALKGSHGTKTAALAAGGDYGDRGGAGVASGADIVFVNTWGSGSGSLGAMTELADGIAFVLDVAKMDGKPCVVNVSLGDDMGPRNGKSPIERFIAEVTGPGRAVVVAAGNSHGRRRHRATNLRDGETATFDVEVGDGNRSHASIEIWSRGEGALDLRLEAPDGEGPTDMIVADGLPRIYNAASTRALVLSSPDVATSPGERVIRVELLPLQERGALLPGIFRLHLSARGGGASIDAWIQHRYIRFAGGSSEIDANTITTPGTSPGAITVGASMGEDGALCFFSGRGPGRGESKKPDVVAPGGPLIVASAATTRRAVEASGTSMSAALVTGLVSLAYQRFGPSLTREQLLQCLVPTGSTTKEEPCATSGEASSAKVGEPMIAGSISAESEVAPPIARATHWFSER